MNIINLITTISVLDTDTPKIARKKRDRAAPAGTYDVPHFNMACSLTPCHLRKRHIMKASNR